MKSETILLIGAGVMAEPYLEAAERRGINVAVVETPQRLAALASRFTIVDREPVLASAGDTDWIGPALAIAQRVEDLNVKWGCIGFSEPHVLAAAFVQDVYGLPGPGMRASVASRNKAIQRSLQNKSVGQPEVHLAPSLSEAREWITEHIPAVIKPVDGMGSIGVEKVTSLAALDRVVARDDRDGPVLCEEYVEGQEYSFEALVIGGKPVFTNLTFKTTRDDENFVEIGHRVRYEAVDPHVADRAAQMSRDVFRVLDVRDSVVCIEFRFRNDEAVVMETMVRMPGDHLLEGVSRAHNKDVFAAHLDIALGATNVDLEPFYRSDAPPSSHRFATCFLVATRTGVLRGWRKDDIIANPNVIRWGERVSIGDSVRPATSSSDRIAWAIVHAPSDSELTDLIHDIHDPARVLIASPPEGDVHE